jgi:hypothetical protein
VKPSGSQSEWVSIRWKSRVRDQRNSTPLQSPSKSPLFRQHAEGDVGNQFIGAVERAGLNAADLEGKTLSILINKPDGVCTICVQGLRGTNVAPGILKQLSDRYPGLLINVEVIPAPGKTPLTGSYIQIKGGRRIN